MKKDEEFYKGKVIRVKLNNTNFFYTIKEVLLLNSTHLGFTDKFGVEKGVKLNDIIELIEEVKEDEIV